MKVKERSYYKNIGSLKNDLGAAIPREELRDLHRVSALRHFLVAGRHWALFLLCGWALIQDQYRWLWPIAAILQGANILGFLILVHEQVHQVIFEKRRPRLEYFLGLLYAAPSAISVTQFTHWHLDHHNELGHPEDDPKRAHLSPKKNSRWLKLLYCTPALFAIYAKAAKEEVATYAPQERSRITRERLLNLVVHLGAVAAIWLTVDGWAVVRAWVIPVFFCFPPFFVLNRLGQHFDIDPTDPAKWSSRVDGNPIWRFLFLWSNFHIEHHYYQRVPFYNLTKLNRSLQPFYRQRGIRNHSYHQMLWGWFVKNKQAHTDWSLEN